jgi:hypothetical protein
VAEQGLMWLVVEAGRLLIRSRFLHRAISLKSLEPEQMLDRVLI